MKNKKNILIIIILLIIILIILLTVIIINKKRDIYVPDGDESNIQIKVEYQKVNNDTLFYTVADCIQSYYDYVSSDIKMEDNNDEKVDSDFTEQEKKDAIYSVLDQEYIEKNNITLDNLYNYVTDLKGAITFTPIDMYMIDNGKIQKFSVYGMIENEGNIIYDYFIVSLDYYNMTYSIEPIEKNKYKDITEIKLVNTRDEIEANDYNIYVYNRISKEDLINKYIYYYKTNALLDINVAYNKLNEEYREKRFGNLEAYKSYVEANKVSIYGSTLDSYKVEEGEDKTQYICIDKNGNYYIINERSIMDFDIMLDNYTIEQKETIEKYNNATDQQKVALNINKFIQAINNSDYRYAYNCLADSYKNNYFKTQEEFETYAKENFYKSSNVGYVEFDKQGDVYTYKVILTDKESEDKKNKTFIMQLGEGTNFVLSFDK